MMTPTSILVEAFDRGQRFEAHGDKLRVIPAESLPADFVDGLRSFKRQLLVLLGLPFVCVNARSIGETIFFCEDETTKSVLIRNGADPSSIYTKAELRILAARNRIKPLTQAELRKLHEIKRTFGASVSDTRWIRW